MLQKHLDSNLAAGRLVIVEEKKHIFRQTPQKNQFLFGQFKEPL